jgi:hypothetical protein
MNPKEKAKELFKKLYQPIFYIDFGLDVSKDIKRYEAAKQCALIAVDEIINNSLEYMGCDLNDGEIIYWQEVKQEIEII